MRATGNPFQGRIDHMTPMQNAQSVALQLAKGVRQAAAAVRTRRYFIDDIQQRGETWKKSVRETCGHGEGEGGRGGVQVRERGSG